MLRIGYREQVLLVLSKLCLRQQLLDVERVGFLTNFGSVLLGAWTDGYISSLHYSPVSLSLASQPSYVLIDGKWRRTRFVRFNHFWPRKIQEREFKLLFKEFQGRRCFDGYLDLCTPKIQYKLPLSWIFFSSSHLPQPPPPQRSFGHKLEHTALHSLSIMPLSQLPLPSFTLALSDSVCLRDFQRAHNREIQIPVYALSGDENLMVRRVRDIHLPATDFPARPQRTVDLRSAPAQALSFIVYKSEYYLVGCSFRISVSECLFAHLIFV